MSHEVWHKAVLVYPKFDTVDTFWSYELSLKLYSPPGEFGLPKRLLPPLGLMGLYRYLKPFYKSLQLIDRNVDPRSLASLIAGADHVYMGGMMAQEQGMLIDARIVKQAGITLIVGGTAIIPDSPLLQVADHLVENEAEMVIDDLLTGLADGHAKKYYLGTPAPPERLFKPDYSAINFNNYVHMAMQISRGCPENCEFCDIPARFGKSFRLTPANATRESFVQLYELGWQGPVFIVDDNFIGNPKRALQALKNLYSIGENIGFHHPKYTELTLRLADDSPIMAELRQWFRKTNFTTNFYGVETPNKAALQETDKRQNLRGDLSIEAKLKLISEQTGAGVLMGMIYGFDQDKQETVSEFIDFVNSTHAPVVMVGLLNALPKTPLMTRVIREGRFIQASSCNNSDGVINFIPWNFSIEQAEKNYLQILLGIYNPKAYFQRVLRHLELFTPAFDNNARSGLENITTLLKLMSHKNARSFWCYLLSAHRIAQSRCGFFGKGYSRLIAEYFALCGQYTHFRDQTEKQQARLEFRQYQPWQQFSWQTLLATPVQRIEVIKINQDSPIETTIKLHMPFDYTLQGTRIEALGFFIEPFLQQGLKSLNQDIKLSVDQFFEVEVQAYYQVYLRRQEILDGLNFTFVECYLRDASVKQSNYFPNLSRKYRKIQAIEKMLA